MAERFVINGQDIQPGDRVTLELPVPQLYTRTPISMPVHVLRGKRSGPRLFVSAAVHGDELNGVEIIRRLMTQPGLKRLRGVLLCIPIVNVYGVIHHSRYLPDRRDLNRSFPGNARGSLAARLAHQFMTEIVLRCTHGIDLHTGSNHRDNLPQIRANLDDPETARLAHLFGVPVLLNSDSRDGSLRAAARDNGLSMLLYESGEGLRFDEVSVRAGLQGIRHVMRGLGMLPAARAKKGAPEPFVARSSTWIRAPESGIFRNYTPLGARVQVNGVLGAIADPFSQAQTDVHASCNGVVIGRTNLPLVHAGDALLHVARFEDVHEVEAQVEAFQQYQEEAIETDPQTPIV